MTTKGEIIHGTFVFNDIVFEANYRFNGPKYNQGGYTQCFAISQGVDSSGNRYLGHSYFGDDKFGVEKADIYSDRIIIYLTYPLYSRCSFSNRVQVVILKRN